MPDDENPEQTLNQVQLDFYDAVVNDNLDLGAPVIDAMANNRVVKTDYDGDHYQGKDGNLWDDLIPNGGSNGNGGNTDNKDPSGSSGSTDNMSDNNGSETGKDGESQTEQGNVFNKVTKTEIVTEESPAMTDTVKYLIVFLAVLSVALLFVIGYIAMRMCTKRRMKPLRLDRRASQPRNDIQYAGDDTK